MGLIGRFSVYPARVSLPVGGRGVSLPWDWEQYRRVRPQTATIPVDNPSRCPANPITCRALGKGHRGPISWSERMVHAPLALAASQYPCKNRNQAQHRGFRNSGDPGFLVA